MPEAAATHALETVRATRYVTPFKEGGSMPGLMEADDDGLYVVKFRAAGQGTLALAAELIAASLAADLGFAVPRLAFVDVDPAIGVAEPDPEIQELIMKSPGLNLGSDFLPGSLSYSPAAGAQPDADFAADLVWFDAFLTNVDRTPKNPNLLVWHGELRPIDHGAAIYLQHAGLEPGLADRAFPQIADHVLLPAAGSVVDAADRCAAKLDRGAIERAVGLVPDDWFSVSPSEAYVEYLTARLARATAIGEEAEHARR